MAKGVTVPKSRADVEQQVERALRKLGWEYFVKGSEEEPLLTFWLSDEKCVDLYLREVTAP